MSEKATAPTTQRIELLDVIRGFALIGILYANVLSWSGFKFLPFGEIRALGDFAESAMIYRYLKFFVDTKFYTIFSLLFGIGFGLQISKNKDNPGFIPLYTRRLAWLLLIGILHAALWSGDILMLYALMGFILLSLRNLEQQQVLRAAVILYFTPLVLDIIYMHTFAASLAVIPQTALKVYPDMEASEVVAAFQSENFMEVLKVNFHNILWRWYDFIPSGRPFKVLGLFLLGTYLYKAGYFSERVHQWKVMLPLLIAGLTFTGITIYMSGSVAAFSKTWSNWIYKLVHEIGQVTLALSYISLIAILLKRIPGFFGWKVLKAYGRMSLTSYIGHSILGILAFYPFIGFGLYGQLSLGKVYYVATGMLLFQFIFSLLWFRWFKFGPIEWAWRCLTYQKRFPILNSKYPPKA